MTRWMHPPELERPRQQDQFDPLLEGDRYGLSRELALAIWKRACADAADSAGRRDEEQARQRFYELAARIVARGGRLRPDPGRVTRVGVAISGDSPGTWIADELRARVPGRETLVAVEARRWAVQDERPTVTEASMADEASIMAPNDADRLTDRNSPPDASAVARAMAALQAPPRSTPALMSPSTQEATRVIARLIWPEDIAKPLVPGPRTLVDHATNPRLGFDDDRVLGLKEMLQRLGPSYSLTQEQRFLQGKARHDTMMKAAHEQHRTDHTTRGAARPASGRETPVMREARREDEAGRAHSPDLTPCVLASMARRPAHAPATLLRQPAPPVEESDPDHPVVAEALAGVDGGEPLPEAVRARMAARFGYELDRVRVHRDAVARDAARALGATAFTVGENIFFADGAYAPDDHAGERLLAHEVAHVVQGYQGRVPAAGAGVRVVDPADALEREADAAAGGSGELVAGHRSGEHGAGGVAGARAVLRVPAPPPGTHRDASHLQITGGRASIDYYAYIALSDSASEVYRYTSDTWNRTATWILYDSSDVEVYRNEYSLGAGNFSLRPTVVRRHVENSGPSRLGAWTLRFIKDVYYDDKAIQVGGGTGPGPALTDAQTTTALFNIRQLPSTTARVLATMPGTSVPVTVIDKVQADGYNWYHITLHATIGSMATGADGWVREEGVVATVSWSFFRDQLHRWEAQQTGLDLSQRITRLRQMCHNSNLPFDSVIGVGAGTEYLDTRGFVRSEWQILRDSQVVRMPDGVQVDVYHLLVGLDVLPRRVEHQTYNLFDVGQNYSAATWAGDIGAGVADAVIRQDADWERAMIPTGASDQEQTRLRTEHYYTSRAPEADLLGDIDAWGIDSMRSEAGAPTTIEELLANFYGTPAAAPSSGGGQVTPRRRAAIERFLRHYGFHTATALRAQAGSRDRMQQQIEIFARMWIRNRQHVWSDTSGIPSLARAMTDRFLDWLEALARANGANVPGPAASQPTR